MSVNVTLLRVNIKINPSLSWEQLFTSMFIFVLMFGNLSPSYFSVGYFFKGKNVL